MDFDEYEYLEKAVEAKSNGLDSHTRGSGEKERDRERERRSSDSKRRSGDEERDRDRSKRPRSEDKEHRDRDRDRGDREKGRERDRGERERDRGDRERDREKDRHREHRERDKEKERDREKDKEREKSREKKDRDREKEKEREREKEKEKEKEKERESRRSKSRHRDEERDRERYRERSKDRDYRDRRKKDDEPEADPERDQRTVFAYQLSLRADERDVYEFFSKAGKVRDVRLIMDRNSRRSKGVGYIEFYDVMSVPMAIALSGQLLMGQPVMVKPSEAEKNMVQTTAATGVSASGGGRKIYVGNLHTNINEEQLRQVFEPFGPVELVQLPMDPMTGLCKGFGFIQFSKVEDAKAAQSLNGQLDIAGRTIKVSLVTDQPPVQTGAATTGDLDDDEGGGLSLNASSRALLMAKLDRTGTTASLTSGIVGSTASTVPIPGASVLGAPPVLPNPLIPTIPNPAFTGISNPGLLPNPALPSFEPVVPPSECLLLKNMFDPSLETEPDFDLDIKDDVQEECSKFGVVKHIFVDKNTSGFVYLRFDSINSAMNAQRALHGRWFAGKMITATFMTPQQYEAKFPGHELA
ncbi:hypothetical protein LUZ60_015049 [Juncus effusus]|nr:hypothetical protein LUZ60_015049 [Juncus effusus]